MSKFLRSRKNPFDKFAQGAKIPDGKTNQSVGLASTAAFEIELDVASMTDFLVAPGLYQAIVPMYKATATATSFKPNPGIFGDIAIGTYATNVTAGTGGAAPTIGPPPTFTPTTTNTATYPHRWRLVSAGVRFSLLNNSDENEGWWECVRTTNKISENQPDDMNGYIGADQNYVLGATPFLRKKNPADPNVFEEANITSENTYVSGRLRDIHQLTFTLNSISNEHEFVEMTDQPHGVSRHFDPSYDMLNFRMHPREATNGPKSRLVCHVQYNYEIEYQPGTLLAKMASAGWGGAYNRSSKGDRVSPATVTTRSGFGMRRTRGGGARSRKSVKKKPVSRVGAKRVYKKRKVVRRTRRKTKK